MGKALKFFCDGITLLSEVSAKNGVVEYMTIKIEVKRFVSYVCEPTQAR